MLFLAWWEVESVQLVPGRAKGGGADLVGWVAVGAARKATGTVAFAS